MAWTAPRTWSAGELVTAALLNTHVRDNQLHLRPAAWADHTPVWTGTGNPAIGNGTLVSRYYQLGDAVFMKFKITMGSTSSYGTGSWGFSLPVTADTTYNPMGNVLVLDSGTAFTLDSYIVFSTSTVILFRDPPGGDNFKVTVPQTWATSDYIHAQFWYTAA